MRLPRTLVRPIAAALLATTAGCYSYVPVDRGAPEAGQDVKIEVGESMGEPARTYRGRVLQVEDETLVLSETVAQSASSVATGARDERVVRIQRSRIRSVEREEVSFWKSAALIAAGGVAASVGLAALAGTFKSDTRGPVGDDNDTGAQSISIPFP